MIYGNYANELTSSVPMEPLPVTLIFHERWVTDRNPVGSDDVKSKGKVSMFLLDQYLSRNLNSQILAIKFIMKNCHAEKQLIEWQILRHVNNTENTKRT